MRRGAGSPGHEKFLLESQKGSHKLDRPARKRGAHARRRGVSREYDCILVARDREGRTIDAVTGRGALRAGQLTQHLLPRLAAQALLVTDAHAAYHAFAKEHGIAHQALNASGERLRAGTTAAIHLQNGNAFHGRLKGWLMPFRGVASHYLANYLGWRWALDGGRISTVEQLLRIAISVIHRQR